MQETSTPATPKGLEGYMDDTHPYHEAVEITRVPVHFTVLLNQENNWKES